MQYAMILYINVRQNAGR